MHDPTTDHVYEETANLIKKLRNKMAVTESEIAVIATWAGNGEGDFYDLQIINGYGLKSGENTWRQLAARLRARCA